MPDHALTTARPSLSDLAAGALQILTTPATGRPGQPPILTWPTTTITLPNGLELTAYVGADGATVLEIDSDALPDALASVDRVPVLRVWVNEHLAVNLSPDTPLPGSDDADGIDR